jgi:hypothetical protein
MDPHLATQRPSSLLHPETTVSPESMAIRRNRIVVIQKK